MRIAEALLRLPLQFDAATLAAEVEALPAEAWRPHPNRIPGNEAVFLATTEGRLVEDLTGPMAPTEYLRASPYMMQAMAAIGAVWGRCRLMRLAPGAKRAAARRHQFLLAPPRTHPRAYHHFARSPVHLPRPDRPYGGWANAGYSTPFPTTMSSTTGRSRGRIS